MRKFVARCGKWWCFWPIALCAGYWMITLLGAATANTLISPAPCQIRFAFMLPFAGCPEWFSQRTNQLLNLPISALFLLPFEMLRAPPLTRGSLLDLSMVPPFLAIAAIHISGWLYAIDHVLRWIPFARKP